MEDRSKQIDESTDELIILIKHHVEEILQEYYLKHGIKSDYDVRDDAVLGVYAIVVKKGTHDTKFQERKGQYIRVIAKNYIFGYSTDSRTKNDLDISE